MPKSKSSSEKSDSHLLIPSWLYQQLGGERDGPSEQVIHLYPKMDFSDLRVLALLLNHALSDEVNFDRGRIVFGSGAEARVGGNLGRVKEGGSSGSHRWTSLRAAVPQESGGFALLPLFKDERVLPSDHFGETGFEANFCPGAREFLLSATLPQLSTARLLGRDDLLALSKGLAQAPQTLLLFKSLWLNRSLSEVLVLLATQETMQVQSNWLHFDGVFALPLSKLVSLLEENKEFPVSDFARVKIRCSQMGRCFADHGLIAPKFNAMSLALTYPQVHNEVLFSWQLQSESRFLDDLEQHRLFIAKRLVHILLQELRQDYLKVVTEGLSEGPKEKISQFFKSICIDALECDPTDKRFSSFWKEISWGFLNSQKLRGLFLFEALVSSLENSVWVPSHDLCSSDFWHALRSLGSQLHQLNYLELSDKFLGMLESDECRHWLEAFEGEACSGSGEAAISRLEDRARDLRYEKILAKPKEPEIKISPVKPEAPIPQTIRSEPHFDIDQASGVSETPSKGAIEKVNLQSIASQELARLKNLDPKGYENLKQNFFASLDDQKKKMISEFLEQMGPTLFENHLKNSLVRFMIENPLSWKGAPQNRTATFTSSRENLTL